MKSHAKVSDFVKWSQYTTLKISNKKHQTSFSSLRIFPSLQIQCSCISNRFIIIFSLKNKSINNNHPKSEMSRLNVRQCSCISNRFIIIFSLKNKSINNNHPKSEMSRLNVRFLGAYGVTDCKISSLNLQRWSSASLLGCPWRQLSQVRSLNLKGWSSDAIANSRAFICFCASIVRPSCNFENSQHLSSSTELWTKDITRSCKQ